MRGDGAAVMHGATLRGYTALGKRYYPQIRPIGWKEVGVASWYGAEFHGRKTSSGETYNMYAYGTAAHKTLPMNTIALVTHRESGAKVKVRINDRGPFVEGRIIDLNYVAGKALGLDKTGTAPVTIEVLEYDAYITERLGDQPTAKRSIAKSDSAAQTSSGAFFVQIGSFRNIESASRLKENAQNKAADRSVSIQTVKFGSENLYRVVITGFNSKEEATRFKEAQGFTDAVVARKDNND
ncbi:MAG: septal ring lytic transglycosylase RlpA family protein [Helicobacteraceae bacterium]|nr:septal ring lytic transglycosylase RlpA family protein [Helicobacteraceae bacterium]